MSELDDAFAESVPEITGTLGVSGLVIGGKTYHAVIAGFEGGRELGEGGYFSEASCAAFISADQIAGLTITPEKAFEGQAASVEGRTYRVSAAAEDAAGVTLTLAPITPKR